MVEVITIIIYLSIYIGLVATSFYILSYLGYRKKKRKFFSEDKFPSVSVLIPAYNEEKSIARTIKSILKTDYLKDRFEVIVINNNSTDRTYEIAKRYEKKGIRVYTEKKKGKSAALNLGISKAKGEIIFTMDADTFVEPQSVKNMIHYFINPKVMSVTPTMLAVKPKSIWQRIQYMEYYLGVFLRKAFATMGAVYVTPGAFSAYRKKFFDKYGGYDENNLTEDLEISLRIQYHGYLIENSEEAPVHTMIPNSFRALMIQRRRWYTGFMKNVWNYRGIISKDYGDLGVFVVPVGIISIIFALTVFTYLIFKTFFNLINEIIFLVRFRFDFPGIFDINLFVIERFFFLLFTNQVFLLILVFLLVTKFYLSWTKKRVSEHPGRISLYLFFVFFAMLFSFWWVVSIIYTLFKKDVKWR